MTLGFHKEEYLDNYYFSFLPKSVSSDIKLFADDCLLYIATKSIQDQINFQKSLDELHMKTEKWVIKFNASKCQIMRIHRSTKPLDRFVAKKITRFLAQVDKAKYLEVMITEYLVRS